MAMVDIRTTPVDFQTYRSITDSKGMFKTWTDIVNMGRDWLPVSGEITQTLIKNPTIVTGDNITFENFENKNVTVFNQDLTKHNNKLAQDKNVMILYDDYMLTLEVDTRDSRSLLAWSELLSSSMTSQLQSKQDLINMETIDTVNKVNIALGQVKVFNDIDELSMDYGKNKALGLYLAKIRVDLRKRRTKFMRGYDKSLETCLIGPTLSLNLLSGMTASAPASDAAYSDSKNRFTTTNVFGHDYITTNMYLEQDILMSEFKDDKNVVQNQGINTGNLIKPYHFSSLSALIFFKESILSYSHEFQETNIHMANTRTQIVYTKPYRFNTAIKPVYAKMNLSVFNKIPKFESYTNLEGNVVPALDMSKKADYESLVNGLYATQKMVYDKFNWNGAYTIDQGDLDKMWADNTIDWKTFNLPYRNKKNKKN